MRQFRIEALSKHYGSQIAVNPVSFTVHEGRCTVLLGPNGAGKTTILNMIASLLQPTSGQVVKVDGDGKSYSGDLRSCIGYLPQYPQFHGWMNGKEWLEMMARLSGRSAADAKMLAEQWLMQVGLEEAGKRNIASYSGGMKQRLGLAQAMIHEPELLILDEPVSALDPFGRREVMELLRELKKKTTVLFSTHILHDAEELCDDLVIVKKGNIVVQGEWEHIQQQAETSMITLEVQAVPAALKWLEQLQFITGVHHVQIAGKSATLRVTNISAVRSEIMQQIVHEDIPLQRFETGGLESFFMEVVNAS